MITFAPRFPAIWLSETYARSDNLSRLICKLANVGGKNKYVIYLPRSVPVGKNCALGLEYGPRPAASGRTQDRGHSFSLCGPPGR